MAVDLLASLGERVGIPRRLNPLQLQQKCSVLPELPQVERNSGNMYPIFITNETSPIFRSTEETIRNFDANGYLVGVGAGNIFRMLNIFPEGRMPRGIIGADVMPEVVLAGRVIVDLLKTHATPQAFVDALGAIEANELEKVIAQESSVAIRRRLQEPESQEAALSGLRLIKEIYNHSMKDFETYSTGHILGGSLSKELVRDLMQDTHFQRLRSLALQGGIVLSYKILQTLTLLD